MIKKINTGIFSALILVASLSEAKSSMQTLPSHDEVKKELETVLNSIPVPTKDIKKTQKTKKQKKVKIQSLEDGIVKLDEVDVKYEENIESKELDINDEKVRDRWSRYIGAMGIDAVAK